MSLLVFYFKYSKCVHVNPKFPIYPSPTTLSPGNYKFIL